MDTNTMALRLAELMAAGAMDRKTAIDLLEAEIDKDFSMGGNDRYRAKQRLKDWDFKRQHEEKIARDAFLQGGGHDCGRPDNDWVLLTPSLVPCSCMWCGWHRDGR